MKNKLWYLIPTICFLFLHRLILFNELPESNDLIAHKPIANWVQTVSEFPQWFPNLFSGMPSYGGYVYTPGDPTKSILKFFFFNRGLMIWFYLTIGGLGMFFFLKRSKISTIAAVFAGIIFCLTPYSFGLINAGHFKKLYAIAIIPWVLMSSFQVIERPSLKHILFLSLVTALQLWLNHPQIVYYTWMVIGFYWIWTLGYSAKEKLFSLKESGRQISGILVGLFLAFLMVSDPYMDIYEFQKHSNRGAKSVLDQTGQTESGTDWNYATQWSFHPKETISFLFPYHYGLQNSQDLKHGAYWGFMPFTQSTHYLGLVVVIFALLGALLKKPDKEELFYWSTTILILLTGFGSFFPILFKPFFEYFPFFSKFRVPSMIYALLAITFPILAAKGFETFIINAEKKYTFKKVIYIAGGVGILSILFLMLGDSIFNFTTLKDGRYNPSIIAQLKIARIELFQKGLILAIFVSLSSLGLIWGYIRKKFNKQIFGYLLIGLTILDLWVINNEFLHLKPAKNMDRLFQENTVIDYLKKDYDHYRIFPADALNSNVYGYWNIESIGGYRPVKLRNYQDLMDAKGFSRTHILDMLNVKYVITRKKINNPNFESIENIPGIYKNNNVLPKAWLVGNIKVVSTQRESLMETLLKSFKPSQSAIVLNYNGAEVSQNVAGKVHVVSKEENRISLKCETETGGLLVLSEIYYKPGWRAFINGNETTIYQTNHVLRSVFVPSGDSDVLFEYNSKKWENTRRLSRISFLTVLLLFGLLFWKERKK
tara:strand:+ start:1504 stop:3804 length:2301 start_codon:yes stop_codon:yes gene_type:complete